MAFFCPLFSKQKAKEYEDSNYFSFDSGGRSLYSCRSMTALNAFRTENVSDQSDQKSMDITSIHRMMVTCDFEPTVDDELRVRRGDIVKGLYRDREWIYVVLESINNGDDQKIDLDQGFIPAIYCQDLDDKKSRKRDQKLGSFSIFKSAFNRRNRKRHCEKDNDDKYSDKSGISKDSISKISFDDMEKKSPRSESNDDQNVKNPTPRSQGLLNVDRFLRSLEQSDDSMENQNLDLDLDSVSNEHSFPFGSITEFNKFSQGRLIVDYDFMAQTEDDINVRKGELLVLLNQDDPHWFWIRREDGEEGFVPSNYVRKLDANKCLDLPKNPSSIVETNGSSNNDGAVQFNEFIATADFEPEASDDLRVIRGDWIYSYQTSAVSGKGWLWAYCPRTKRYGFIPRSIVKAPLATIL